ncbi:Rpn family recombination-promoting nuclease/putative transposase [Argonema galeatum]|uniref:Rpn family recombination-promoting nuclease/putative transposase n=1 Tax=Argonema galeatum TaxID=2942762 RepID=UPI0020136FBC|nr:Rpn family recombination-promoting nuclease/putative transposase [Argonema galeatum]MCL1466243.1 Rpn family recombination-promoting nuclease/putative transposase [Argonema galeatum A003/A1]
MTNPFTEFDSPWKDILQRYFEEFILFFFPQAHEEIDWTRTPEFLDKELQQVVRDAELGRRLVDKLVKIYLRGGEEAWVLIHIEVQSQEESDFAERMFTYHYRIYDRYKRSVASLAVLGDERKNWRPERFGYQLFGCEIGFRFPVVKLLDYQQQWSALSSSRNPFATVVMAHLKAIETRDNRNQRKEWKLALTRRLYEQGYEREDVINLFQFIDWVMSLPQELEQQFWQEVIHLEEESRMPYITSVERIGIQKGIQQGIEQERQQSRQQVRQILLESIELGLELKFGSEGLSLLPEISLLEDVEQLRAIQAGLRTVNTVEELRRIYQPTTQE